MSTPPDRDDEAPVKCVCGRPLTDPVSRGRGLGPRCYKRLRGRPKPRRIVGTHTARSHPLAVPKPPEQLTLAWNDDQDDEPDPYRPRPITDVPTGALL